MKRRTAFLLLAAWVALIWATHRGPRSPYTYGPQAARSEPVTQNAARDALTVRPVTRFFYDGTTPDFATAHNLRLPLHSFLVATAASFVRAYPLANELVNLLMMLVLLSAALRVAERFGIEMRAACLALATVCALPPIVGYIGQPMHYIVGPAVSFLVLLIALVLEPEQLRNPIVAGLLTAVLLLNYDPYIYAGALAAYLLFIVRFRRRIDVLLYALVAAAPVFAWQLFLRAISGGGVSTAIRDHFIGSILSGWLDFVMHPSAKPLLPLAVTQIGFHLGVHEVIAIIYWPIAVCCLIGLWNAREQRPHQLLLFLVALFALEQILFAAFDWENNPRRALPVFFAFACAYCWIVSRNWSRRPWLISFIALFAFTALIGFADTLLGTPSAPALYMGETVRWPPKRPLDVQDGRIEVASTLDPEYAALAMPFPRARIQDVTLPFVAANVFVAAAIAALLWIAARAKVLPRFAPHAAGLVWLLSAIRFVV